MSNGFKDWLRGLAQSGSNPVGSAVTAYDIGLRRKASLVDQELKKRQLGILGQQTNINEETLKLKQQTADPEYINRKAKILSGYRQEVAAGPQAYGLTENPTVREQFPHPGGEELAGPPALPDEPLGEELAPTRGPWVETKDRPATDAEVRKALEGAQLRSGLIKKYPSVKADELKQKGLLDRKRAEAAEGITPGLLIHNARVKEMTRDQRARNLLNLFKSQQERDKYTGEITGQDEALYKAILDSLGDGPQEPDLQLEPPGTAPTGPTPTEHPELQSFPESLPEDVAPQPPAGPATQPSDQLPHENVQLDPAKMEAAKAFIQHFTGSPEQRKAAIRGLPDEVLQEQLPLLQALHDAGIIQLDDEDIDVLVERGFGGE